MFKPGKAVVDEIRYRNQFGARLPISGIVNGNPHDGERCVEPGAE
jgi:hypothetical protein